jgi:hypothetical protein
MPQIADAFAKNLVPFVQDSIEPGSVVHTNGSLGHLPLGDRGYDHEVTSWDLHGDEYPKIDLSPESPKGHVGFP